MTLPAQALEAFAPTGRLRAAINLGNPILASLDASGAPCGVSVDLAGALAQRLGLELEPLVFEKASQSVEAVTSQAADIGFFAIDPARGAGIAFTSPYVLIEGCYLVAQDSPIQTNAQVDQPQHRVVVGAGSAYDLYLTRTLAQAQLVRASNSQTVVQTFLEQQLEVAAGVKQQLEADVQRLAGQHALRMLPESFMVIEQAMGLPKARGPELAQYLAAFVEDMKASGFVAQALQRHHINGARVAPAATAGTGA